MIDKFRQDQQNARISQQQSQTSVQPAVASYAAPSMSATMDSAFDVFAIFAAFAVVVVRRREDSIRGSGG